MLYIKPSEGFKHSEGCFSFKALLYQKDKLAI